MRNQANVKGLEKVKQSLAGLNHAQVAYQLYKLLDDRRWEDSYAICQMIILYAWGKEKQLRAENKATVNDDVDRQCVREGNQWKY